MILSSPNLIPHNDAAIRCEERVEDRRCYVLLDSNKMEWIDVLNMLPEDGIEVLCAITKFGKRTIDKSYQTPYIDKEGKEWWKVGEQVYYELLWREDGKWVNYEIDDYESNPDYMTVIAWTDRLNYKLEGQ